MRKKIIITIFGFLISLAALAQPSTSNQVAGTKPQAPSSKTAQQKEIKIFIADIAGLPLSENSPLFPPLDWYQSKLDTATSASALMKEGWNLFQIIPINAKQYYWVFTR